MQESRRVIFISKYTLYVKFQNVECCTYLTLTLHMFTFSLLGTYFKEFTKLEKKTFPNVKLRSSFSIIFFKWPGAGSLPLWPGSGSTHIWPGSGSTYMAWIQILTNMAWIRIPTYMAWIRILTNMAWIWTQVADSFLVNIKKYSVGFKQDSDPQHWADLAWPCILWVIKVPFQDLLESFREEKRKKGR